MLITGKLVDISTVVPKISTFLSADESGGCPVSGACEVFKSSLQSIRQCAITSTSKGMSTLASGSKRNETPRFANSPTFSPLRTSSFAKNGDWFEFV